MLVPRTQIFLHSSSIHHLIAMEPQATRWSITPLFAKADKITNLSILYLFSFDDNDFSHDAGRYLRSVSSEVAEETNPSTKLSQCTREAHDASRGRSGAA